VATAGLCFRLLAPRLAVSVFFGVVVRHGSFCFFLVFLNQCNQFGIPDVRRWAFGAGYISGLFAYFLFCPFPPF
jgi:hypothetical protein